MKFLGIIPARYASVRFPGKPLAKIQGKTMIQRVVEQVSKALEYVIVATDDERIFKHVRGFGGKVVMTATSHRNGTERCNEALQLFERASSQNFDVVINVQGDEPFIQPEQIEKLKSCFSRTQCQIATLVKPIVATRELTNPHVVKVVCAKSGKALYFSRSLIPYPQIAELSKAVNKFNFYKHIGIYAYRSEVLKKIVKLKPTQLEKAESLEQLRWLENGYSVFTKETDLEIMGIDTPEDLDNVKGCLS